MGSSKGGGATTVKSQPVKSTQVLNYSSASNAPMAPTVNTPQTETITPAVARDVGQDTQTAQQNQALARSRLAGIRSTWTARKG